MVKKKAAFNLILFSIVSVLLLTIGTLFFIRFYTAERGCTALEKKIQELQERLLASSDKIIAGAKKNIQNQIEELQTKIEKLKNQKEEIIKEQIKSLAHEVIDINQKLLPEAEEELKKDSKELLADAKKEGQNQVDIQEKNVAIIKKRISKLPENGPAVSERKDELQKSLKKFQKLLTDAKKNLALPDDQLLTFYKNDIQEKVLMFKKAIKEHEKILNDPTVLKKEIEKKGQLKDQEIKALEDEIASLKATINQPDEKLIQYGQIEIQKELLDLKTEYEAQQCTD